MEVIMANLLDENTDKVSENRDIRVIDKQIPITVGKGSLVFEIVLWILGILPGLIFLVKKISAKNRLLKLEQKLQYNASQVDNYLEQRVVILKNCVSLVSKAIDLDKSTFVAIAEKRAGTSSPADSRREQLGEIAAMSRGLNVVFEQYPELQAHQAIQDAMRQNSYLQKEITAARDLYNDTVNMWNALVNQWPTYRIVAAKEGYTTRIPFSTTNEVRVQARENFFA